ncbi:MAG: ATP phosphoribosyltransferase regulatory subunit [Pseudomonadota bacterium]|nr:ATP phosphoribosyltransferase regulatory subunit [Pseudomonadota bacterium]
MDEITHKALLPAGLRDALPEEAGREAEAVYRLTRSFRDRGYQTVKPPLLEFEESLLTGPGAELAPQLFRLMDPISQKMMGLRADITPQIARVAATRLVGEPRPLRLCYSGQVLRVKGDQLRPERQFTQAGIEMFGATSVHADAEIVLMTVAALRACGVAEIAIDLTIPSLAPLVLNGRGFDRLSAAAARDALDGKDAGELRSVIGEDPVVFTLLEAVGPAEPAIERLLALGLQGHAGELIGRLADLLDAIREVEPDLPLTVDPGEYRGFEYQTGVAFAVFSPRVRGEIGRGGRYVTESGEPAVGATIYLDSLLRALPAQAPRPRLYLPFGTPHAVAAALRGGDWAVVAGLDPEGDPLAEARRLKCGHVRIDGTIRPVDPVR